MDAARFSTSVWSFFYCLVGYVSSLQRYYSKGSRCTWEASIFHRVSGVLYVLQGTSSPCLYCPPNFNLPVVLLCLFVFRTALDGHTLMNGWSPIILPLKLLVLVSNSFASRNCWATMFLFTTSPSFFLTWWINISRYRWIWNNLRATQNASKFFTGMSRVINTRIPQFLANSMVLFPDSPSPLLFAGGDTRCWWLGIEQESKLCVLCWVGLVASCNLT